MDKYTTMSRGELAEMLKASEERFRIMEKVAFRLQDRLDQMELVEFKTRMENERLTKGLKQIAYMPIFNYLYQVEVFAHKVLEGKDE